jgi:hypothetical protein
VAELGPENPQSVAEDETALEAPRGDPPMEIRARRFIRLPAADHKEVIGHRDIEVLGTEAGDRQRNAEKPVSFPCRGEALDIVWREAVAASAGGPFRRSCDPVKAQKERIVERGHLLASKSFVEATFKARTREAASGITVERRCGQEPPSFQEAARIGKVGFTGD